MCSACNSLQCLALYCTALFSPDVNKLDGVGPLITDPPPISFTTLSEKKKKIVTCDM